MAEEDFFVSIVSNIFDEFALYDAIQQKNFKRFRSLINRPDFDINHMDKNGRSLLMQLATIPKSLKFAEELLKKGLNVDLTDKFGYTFLHLAVRAKNVNNLKTGQMIIENGADINCRDNSGLTPLYLACLEGNVDWIHMLLYYGADPNIPSHTGLLPLTVLSTKKTNYLNLLEILFLYIFDSQGSEISLSTVAAAMWRDSPLFPKMVEKTSKISYDLDNINYFCEYFCDFKEANFKIFIEKFDAVINDLLDHVDLLQVIIKSASYMLFGEVSKILDHLLESKYVGKLVQNCDPSTSVISFFIEEFASHDSEQTIQKIFLLLSYGLGVTLQDLETVYKCYGYCDLFKTLLHMDIEATNEEDILSIVRLYYDPGLGIEDCWNDPSSMSELLSYFNYTKLKEVCWVKTEDEGLRRRLNRMDQIPLLLELSRNVTRKYIMDKYKIQSCKQFYAVLNGLPIDRITKSIIALEQKIY